MLDKKYLVMLGVVIVLIFGFVIGVSSYLNIQLPISSNGIDNESPAKKEEMVKIMLEWGRLALFPKEAKDFTISTEGNPFSRSFRAKFTLNPESLKHWIKDSQGLSEASVEKNNAIEVFNIKPGGGASIAWVKIDNNTNRVEVYVSWS